MSLLAPRLPSSLSRTQLLAITACSAALVACSATAICHWLSQSTEARLPATVATTQTWQPGEIATFPALTAVHVKPASEHKAGPTIQLCQFAAPCGPCQATPACGHCDGTRLGVACPPGCQGDAVKWKQWQPVPWQAFGHGEYIGPARTQHVPEYRLRVDDELDFVYRLTRNEDSAPYHLNVGDEIRVESLTDQNLDRELVIQPDGSITLRLLGQVRAARRTVEELRSELEESYKKYYKTPAITVTPLQVNTRLEDLRATVDGRFGTGGQTRPARVTPEGTIQLPGIGSVPAQGLSLVELQREINVRYEEIVRGIEITVVLTQRAPTQVFVLGEVLQPGRYTLDGPTTVMQSIALAGGWNFGGDLRHVVVFRRAEDWSLVATKLDLREALLGKKPCPADEIFLRDSDLVMLPKSSVLLATDFIDLVFVRGIYGIVPNQGVSVNFSGDGSF